MISAFYISPCLREEAANAIQAHRYLYYVMGLPVISNRVYDGLKRCAVVLGADVDGPTIYVAPGANDSLTDFHGAREIPIYTEAQILLAMKFLEKA